MSEQNLPDAGFPGGTTLGFANEGDAMIEALELAARTQPEKTACWFFGSGEPVCETWAELRLRAGAMAHLLANRGVCRKATVAVDAPNCAAYPTLIAAAAYGGFALATLNNRLSDAEKRERLGGLGEAGLNVAVVLDEGALSGLYDEACAMCASVTGASRAEAAVSRGFDMFSLADVAVIMFTSGTTGRSKAALLSWDNLCASARAANTAFECERGDGSLWQATLPLYHVGGLQIVVRSMLAQRPFALYGRFDAARVLADRARLGATHISVVDKTLRDLMDAVDSCAPSCCAKDGRRDDGGEEAGIASFAAYRCVLLGGAAVNPATVRRAARMGARVYASYGMTETASAIAASLVDPAGPIGSGNVRRGAGIGESSACSTSRPVIPLALLPGYRARIIDADALGFGVLAVAGPGVIAGYANAKAAYTDDGFFITGDVAKLEHGALLLRERTGDMFVSGGENVYPEQVRAALLEVPGVADAHVYGAADATWGRRPVAFVERDGTPAGSSAYLAACVREHAGKRLGRISRPDRVMALSSFPRKGIGKTDRAALERMDVERIDVTEVRLIHGDLAFTHPFATANGVLRHRETLFVEVRDAAGHSGVGECASFSTDWYLPETLSDDMHVISEVLLPYVRAEAFAHPGDAWEAFAALPEAKAYPFARAAVETALWDLFGKIVRKPLWQLIGGTLPEGEFGKQGVACEGSSLGAKSKRDGGARFSQAVPVGAVVGIGSIEQTVAQARALAEAGYRRVKLKISPGDFERVSAVRKFLPDLPISLDANQSFDSADPAHREELLRLDALGALWMEEPIAFSGKAADQRDPSAARERFAQLARLQRELSTPVCLDESFFTLDEALEALRHPELRCFAIKVGKFGGIGGALAFIRKATSVGTRVWMSGMYDMGVSKRLHAAFETLPCIADAGDLASPAGYFGRDVAIPPHEVRAGIALLNDDAHPYGVGCDLDEGALRP